LDLVDFVDFNF